MKVASGPHAVPTGAWLSAIDGQISVAVANLCIRGIAIGLWYVCPHGGVFLRSFLPHEQNPGPGVVLVIHQRKH
jgi:hypothetical protein